MAEGVSRLLESVLDRPATNVEISDIATSHLAEWNTGVHYLPGIEAFLARLPATNGSVC